jgi:hypothetical protein
MHRVSPAGAAVLLLSVASAAADHIPRADIRKCSHYGFQQGTAPFANCLLQLETNRSQVQAAATHAHGLRDAAAIQAQAARDVASQNVAVNLGTGEAGFAGVLGQAMVAPQGSTTPPPPFDRYGRANYDSDGTYIGGHGIGTLVDDPDLPAPAGASGGDAAGLVQQDAAEIDSAVQTEVDAADSP